MHFDVTSNTTFDQSLQQHVERRLSTAFGRFGRRVARVIVRLTDENGPRGGEAMRCRVIVDTKGGGRVVVADTRSNMYAAAARAVERAAHAVGNQMKKQRSRKADRARFASASSEP